MTNISKYKMIVHTCFNNCSEHGYLANILKPSL